MTRASLNLHLRPLPHLADALCSEASCSHWKVKVISLQWVMLVSNALDYQFFFNVNMIILSQGFPLYIIVTCNFFSTFNQI